MADFIEEESLAQNKVVKTALIFDNMEIHIKHAEIRTIKLYLDADGNEVRREAGKNFIYMDRKATDTEPICADFTDFMGKIGLTKAKVKQAIREMEVKD